MTTTRRAVIDVGTNSVKLLVADVDGGVVQPVLEESEQTRLGAGFFETHRLQPGAIADTARAIAGFAARARQLEAKKIRVVATSAAREARNPDELKEAIERSAGLKVEIISGEQEADWSFQGVTIDAELAQRPLLLIDVGGGSTEFILGEGRHKQFRQSFRLGTVRLLEKLPPSDPPKAEQLTDCRQFVKEFLVREVCPQLMPMLDQSSRMHSTSPSIQLVSVGGTATILARMETKLETYDRAVIEGARMSSSRIKDQVGYLWGLPLAERKKIPGLPKSRADVILGGVVIFEGVMENLGFSELRVSTRGLRFAAVMDA